MNMSDNLRKYAELSKSLDEGIEGCLKSLSENSHLVYSGCVQWSIDTENELEEFKEQMRVAGKTHYNLLIEVLELKHGEFLGKLENFRQKNMRDLTRSIA